MKFQHKDLVGYGFDLVADRVTRYSKHLDGTYMNTRATYQINQRTWTHHQLRTLMIEENKTTQTRKVFPWKVIAITLIVVQFISMCSDANVNFSSNVEIHEVSSVL